jgi:hypothetical protein
MPNIPNIESKSRNNTSSGDSSSAVPQPESSSMGAATEPRHFSAKQVAIHSHGWTRSRSTKTPTNVCDVPRRQDFEQNGIISMRIEHRALARYTSVPQNTADTQTASPTVAPQPLVKDWSPLTVLQSPRRFAPELSCLVI